jgi:hypothetical protein
MKRDIKVGIKTDDEFFAEAREIARKLDTGWRPELPFERLYFDDLPTHLNMYCSGLDGHSRKGN